MLRLPTHVSSVEFRILSPEMIKKMAVVKISRSDLYDRDGYPLEGGVMDPRLGVIDPGLRCRTCGGNVGDCLGHFGFLELARPVVHVKYAKILHTILRVICKKCGKILASEEDLNNMKNPLKELQKREVKKCPHCSEEQEGVKFVKPTTFKDGKGVLNSSQIRERFERVSDETLQKLKNNGGRPEWLVLTLLPIPPVTIRPSITLETGERSEDDLTHKLVEIVRINNRLREQIDVGAPDFIIEDYWELLQYHVSTYFDNELTGIPQARHRSGRALKTLTQRLKTKEGRFRGNLAGKRVNFSARTVVSPDPNLKLDEVGVPEVIARELTIPEKVNSHNKKWLQEIILNAPNWPSANYVIKPDGRKRRVLAETKEEIAKEIDDGWIVERHLLDGDVSIFNRQPSLHRMSIMSHKVRIMPYRTFRLNLCVVTPYNADFDGDEMNLHIPQTEEAQAEAELLMQVQKHIRSPRFGGPIIGCIKDHITGCFILTRKEAVFTREEAYQLFASAGIEDIEIPHKSKLTGKELFSLLLPKDLSVEFKPSWYIGSRKAAKEDPDSYVIIKKGQLIQGVIDKRAVAPEAGMLLNVLEKEYGNEAGKQFLERVSSLAVQVLTHLGFSVTMSYLDLNKKVEERIGQIIKDAYTDAQSYIKKLRDGTLDLIPGKSMRDSLEIHVQRRLGEALNHIVETVEESLPVNPATIMARAGARGSMVNIAQMAALVGQETIRGRRMRRGYFRRTLSIFKKGDLSPAARGFVAHGYKTGLKPWEFFFDAVNGREGLMDTSLRTRHSGYMERRLVNALQDLTINPDGSIRDSNGNIVQFLAGEDNVDPYKSDFGQFNVARIVDKLVGE